MIPSDKFFQAFDFFKPELLSGGGGGGGGVVCVTTEMTFPFAS
jgi:hypothetical protein